MKKLFFIIIMLIAVINLYAFKVTEKTLDENLKNYSISIKYPYITDKCPAADTINGDIEKTIKDVIKEFKENLVEDLDPAVPYTLSIIDYEITLNRADIFSGYIHFMSYTGGAHPGCSYYTFAYSADKKQASPITLSSLFAGQTEKVKPLLISAINEEKKDRNGEIITSLETDLMKNFALDPFGAVFYFEEYSLGSYAEGEYSISLPWENISKFVTERDLLNFVNNAKKRVNMQGSFILPENMSLPANTKCEIDFIWTPVNKEPRALETNFIDAEPVNGKIKYRVSYDWSDKTDRNDYQVDTFLLFNGIKAYKDDVIIPITSQGFSGDTDIYFSDIYAKQKQDGNYKDIPYIRIQGELVPDTDALIPFNSVWEFRLLDKSGKAVKKQFLKDLVSEFPYKFDIVFDKKDLNADNIYLLKVLLSYNGKVIYETVADCPVSLTEEITPKKLEFKKKK